MNSNNRAPYRGDRWGISRGELVTRLHQVLEFASHQIPRLGSYEEYLSDFGEGSRVRFTDKILIESALLVLVGKRAARNEPKLTAAVERLGSALGREVRSPRNKLLIMRYPEMSASVGIGHAILTHTGNKDPDFDAVFRSALKCGHTSGVERLPYRWMEFSWLNQLVDPAFVPDYWLQVQGATIASNTHPIFMSGDDAYAITHALMFLGNFGLRAVEEIDRGYLSDQLSAIIAWQLADENLDITGEGLLGQAILDLDPTLEVILGVESLMSTWDELGFLPCPSFRADEFAGLEGNARRAYAFEHTYHTTFVGGLLCGVLLLESLPATPSGWECEDDCREPLHPRLPIPTGQELRQAAEIAYAFCGRAGFEGDSSKARDASAVASTAERMDQYFHEAGGPVRQLLLNSIQRHMADARSQALLSDAALLLAAHEYRLDVLAKELTVVAQDGNDVTQTGLAAVSYLLRQQNADGAVGGWASGATSGVAATVIATHLAADAFRMLADRADGLQACRPEGRNEGLEIAADEYGAWGGSVRKFMFRGTGANSSFKPAMANPAEPLSGQICWPSPGNFTGHPGDF
jgi:hypothetical protein